MGTLGLLAAGFIFIQTPIIKMSSPNAFEVIEQRYVDLARVNHDSETRERYEFYKSWIMGNEPALQGTWTIGIAFSLVVSVYCFGLAAYLRYVAGPPNKPLQPTSGGRAEGGSGSMGSAARG
jgi:hypothetical protein